MRVSCHSNFGLGWFNSALFGCSPAQLAHPLRFRPLQTLAPCVVPTSHAPLFSRCQIGTSVALGYQPREQSCFPWGLVAQTEALYMSSALAMLLLLIAALLRPFRTKKNICGAILGPCAYGVKLDVLKGLDVARPSCPVLAWQAQRGPQPGKRSRSRAPTCSLGQVLMWLSLMYALPQPVHAFPVIRARWYLLPAAAHAMARPPRDDDPQAQAYPTRRPHLIPPQELTTHVGSCPEIIVHEPPEPFEGCETRVLSASSPQFQNPTECSGDEGSEWLGIHLYTPHYRPLQLALRPPERTLQSVLDLIVQYDQGPDEHLFDTAVPIKPQRFSAAGSFLRFSSSIRGVGVGGLVAVILDLTHVGGHYFAAVLPQDIHYRTLQEYFLPLTTLDEDPSDVYIGYRDEPWPPQTDVKLTDGDVITVLKQPGGSFHKYRVSTLFEPGAHWNHPKHLFHLNFCTSVCVLYRDKRYCVPEHHHYGRNLVEYVAERLRVNPYCTVMCTFPVSDLDVQGDLCPYVVTVAEVPHPENTGINRDRARDIFVLLDPRPLGHKPCFLFLHHPVVHLPSIEAMLGLSTGRSRRLGVMGGNRQGDDVFVEGCAALVLFAEITDEATSVSEAPSPRDDPLLESPSNQFEEARDADGPRPLGLPLHPVTSTALSSPIGEIWEGGAQLTMEGVELFDPTLPPGQSWNEAFLTNATQGMENPMGQDQAPRGTISTVARDALDAAVTRIQALIFVPDFVPEIVDVAIHLPAAIDSLRSKIQAARSPEQSFSFPMLYQVSPQPLREFAIFVAGPEWQSYTVIVLFDCRRYNHCVFAQAVPGHLSRESLLHAAGVPPDEAVHVYVHGLIQPLAIDQRITLLHGMTISITPRDEGGPACCDLADMLQTADGWDCNAPIPGPAVHFNSHFYLLTEGQPFAFQVKPQGQATFRDDVARAVGSPEHRLSICIVTPRIPDAYPFGYWTSAVLVVTEALSRIPCPPARLPEKRMVLVLDQRRILRGIVWRLVESRVIKVQDIADTYYDICPFRHVVSIEGARNEVRNGESVFILQPGQVLVVEFVPEKCSPTSTDHDTDQPGWPSQTEDHDVTHRYVTAASSLPGATVTETQPGVARSRSPRGRNLQNTACLTTKCPDSVRTSLEPPGPNHKMCKLDLAGKDQDLTSNKVGTEPIVLHDWAPTVQIPLLPIRSLPSGTIGAAARACKLLSEPAGTPWQDSAIDFARDAAQLLGDAWPFPPYRWPIETPEVDDGDSQTIELGEGFMTDIVLFLLTPDYTPERLDLTVQLPQSVEDIVDLAQTCRETARRQLFPVLVEVRQQPDPGWGLFLALPSWLQHRAVVCADLSFFDGRIFAISLHSQTDRYALCDAVGLAPTADVDIYVPGMAAPLPRGADCQLTTGMCIVFVQPGMARPGSFSLRTMLCSHLPWEHSPIFPRDSLENGYCAVGPGGQVLFRLHPERAFYYRADIALLTDLHPLRAVITPAAPQPSDVCVRGWICRAVVAATDRDDQVAWDGTVVPAVPGLLDCRPLMLGWLPVTAPTFWLDLEPIRHALNQSAPAGWRVYFPDLPAHWTWVCFHQGKVVVVAFEEADAQTVSARCDTAGATNPAWPYDFESYGCALLPVPVEDCIRLTTTDCRHLPLCDHGQHRTQPQIAHKLGRPRKWSLMALMCIAGTAAVCISDLQAVVAFAVCTVMLSPTTLPHMICAVAQLPHVESVRHAPPFSNKCDPAAMRRPLPTPVRTERSILTPKGMTNPSRPDSPSPLRQGRPGPTAGLEFLSPDQGVTQKSEVPRATVACTEQLSYGDHRPLITLLEESVASSASEAFFLAATLLDTLLEHIEATRPSASRESTMSRIALLPHLPPPAFGLDADSVQLPHSHGILQQLFSAWPPTWLFPDDWSETSLPPSTMQCLGSLLPRVDVFRSQRFANLSFSLYTDGSATPAWGTSGYAVVVLGHAGSETALLGSLGEPIAGNPASPWVPDGPLSLHAEHIAIAVALLWAMQMRGVIDVVQCKVYFDCTAAGWSATGHWQTSSHTSEFVHHLYMTARAMPGVDVEFAHVRGHSGDPWNDLADYIAKTAAGQQKIWPCPPAELCHAIAAQDISWLAPEMDARVHHAAPIHDGMVHWSDQCIPRAPLHPQQLVPTTQEGESGDSHPKGFSLLAATINIQSLRTKCKYVEDQLVARGIQIAFLQETKLPGGTVTSEHYLRLQTGAESHWGVGIWIHRKLGVLKLGTEALLVDESDVATLHETPRLLVVLLTVGDLRIGLLSGHCPHASRPQERLEFLNTLAPLLQRLKQTNLLIGGIDLNGRIPPNFTGVSGSLEFGEPDETGWSFAPICADAGIWIPSMYTQLHCGDSTTYVHPNGQQHRIDYVFLGGKATVEYAKSNVDGAFDNGSPQEDHMLLQLSIKGSLAASRRPSRLLRPTYDREKILSVEGRERVRCTLAAFQHPAWDVHPDQHCLQLEEFLRNALDDHFAKPPVQRRASYIPDTVWRLREAKVGFRRRVRHRVSLWKDVQCRAFHQWRTEQSYDVEVLLGKQSLLYEIAAAAIRLATAAIKRGIAKAKNAFLYQIAGESQQGAAKIMQRVKQAGVGGSKTRPVSRPLPLLLHPDTGEMIMNRSQRDDVWMLHFGKQEQGQALPTAEFIRTAAFSCYDENVAWSAEMLPTYTDIEKVLRGIHRNKAAGLDNIPGELLRAAPADTARLLFPLFLKSMLLQCQPLQWRGGVLYEAFKRSGLQSSVDNYRSLFVSSYVAKTYHRTVRDKTQALCRDELHPLHLGSKKHAPVTFAALFVLSHLRRSQRLGRSAAVLFLDTSAAYYRIVRELAIGDIRADATVITLFRRFGLDDEDINELMSTVKEGGMLAQAGAPDALRQVVKDIHLHTWFVSRFSDGTKVCSSLAGSRPGESWADLIYAFIYSRVLHKIQEFALAEGLSFTVSFDETEGPFPTTTGATDLVATDTTWADDSAFPLEDESPERLMQKTVRLCTLVISFCEGHGMAPNLKRGKTSVLISLSGKGCKRVRGRYFPAGAKSLHLPDLNVGVVVADQYKHLGGYLDCKLTMKPEARFRLAQAASSYTAAKALLLNSPRLDIKTRAALFASAVTPTFFNIGLWLPSGQAWEMLSNGYSKLVRRLLITNVGAHRAFHVPLPFAHWSTGCWRLDLVARRARLSLLVSLVQAGPPLLWAMLQNEMCWFKVLQVDLQWFVKTEEDSWPRPASCAWPEWHHLLKTAPQRFKRSLRRKLDRAHELQCRQDTALIGQWHCYRTLIDRLPPLTKTLAWTCRLCNKSLSTKAALGAHFFKVHGRVAEYRLVACGTRCDACNTNFWTEGRLAAHLRASPGCVSSLRQRGNQAEQVRPGFGSKKRRQDDSVAFTLSLPSRQGSIPSAPECPDWGKEQRCVYQELCARLFEVEADVTTAALLPSILCILRQKPLYPEEVLSILETIIEEVREITSDGLEDPWTSDTAQVLLQVLDSARSGLWAEPRDQIHPRLAHSLRDFRSFLDDFDWETSLQSLRSDNGTPSVLEFHVLQGWEADWQQNYSQAEVSAVVEDFGTILPEVLRRAWQSLLTGCTVAIHAPLDFWASQLAAPFRWARAPFCKPN